jgi:hypothetical protein
MKDRNPLAVRDDTEGHSGRFIADVETDETDDAEGHMSRIADAELAESDDTEGHNFKL